MKNSTLKVALQKAKVKVGLGQLNKEALVKLKGGVRLESDGLPSLSCNGINCGVNCNGKSTR